MNIIYGFWEGNDDFNCTEFITPANVVVNINGQVIELDRDDENHPACELLGAFGWNEIHDLLEKAAKWSITIIDLNTGEPLVA